MTDMLKVGGEYISFVGDADGDGIQTLRRDFTAVHDLAKAYEQKAKAIQANEHLSAKGKEAAMQKLAAEETLPALERLKQSTAKHRQRLNERREGLSISLPQNDSSLSSEMRSYLRSLPAPERSKVLVSNNTDPRIVAAALSAPDELSGMKPEVRHILEDRLFQSEHSETVAVLGEYDKAVKSVDRITEKAEQHIVKSAGFDAPVTAEMTVQEKAKYVHEHGSEAYFKMKDDKAGQFRPQIVARSGSDNPDGDAA